MAVEAVISDEMTGKKIIIDGQEIWVPEGNLSGRELRERAGLSQSAVLYQVSPDGHRVVEDDQVVEVQEGERFGTVERFITGSDQG